MGPYEKGENTKRGREKEKKEPSSQPKGKGTTTHPNKKRGEKRRMGIRTGKKKERTKLTPRKQTEKTDRSEWISFAREETRKKGLQGGITEKETST